MATDIKSLKIRIRSVDSTLHLTRAMGLVAASKIRRATRNMNTSREYVGALDELVSVLRASPECERTPYMSPSGEGTRLIVIAGDRGLAGGYNGNVLKLAWAELQGKEACVLPIGKKAVEFFHRRGTPILTEAYAEAAEISVSDCFSAAKLLCRAFLDGEFDEISVIYTSFVSILSQTPSSLKLLPLQKSGREKTGDPECLTLYEPSSFAVYDAIIPEYIGGVIYGALCESVASEQGARRTAMDAATKNAEEMIEDLNLKFNRARQGAITQEITEIVAGGES